MMKPWLKASITTAVLSGVAAFACMRLGDQSWTHAGWCALAATTIVLVVLRVMWIGEWLGDR
jgi:hypothetical protein